jgi:predicted porin
MFFNLARTGAFGLNNHWAPILVISRADSQGPAVNALAPPLRVGNMVRYRYGVDEGSRGGVKVDAAFAMGERAAASGNFTGLSIGYQGPEYFVGLSTQRAHTGTAAAAAGNTYAHALSAYRKFGDFKLNFNYVVTGATAAGSRDARHVIGGAEYRTGPHALLLEVVQRNIAGSPNDSTISAVGYDYSFSKRTAVYGRVLQVANKAGAAVAMATAAVTANSGDDVRGIAIGIRHNF